ncbi:amidase [Acuticoccus sp. I52.16.1]|uniref:amidase n=1 Tax=Acuticoccus sp. I52.16.1 TaxID=2928472 RepID=UPI001FD285B2|nr:amidase [Acuticoccus sp. I52.16.1]UOM35557.1 amidase [Acuticoccus sp. I52.16.1]
MIDIATLRRSLEAGTATALTLAEEAFARIAAGEGAINAFVSLTEAEAMAAARESAARWAAGAPRGPLDGIPVAVKDNLAMAGTLTTGGHRAPPDADIADAFAVARLKRAGAVIVGKANMDEGALGATTANPHHGATINPHAEGHTAGGSSGGSAAAVAAGYVPLALGSDTLGSVRIPASYCGVWGLKPTRGAIGRTGIAELAPSLDTIGVLAATAADLMAGYDALCFYDHADVDSVPLAERVAAAGPRCEPPVVGILDLPGVDLDGAVGEALRRAAEALAVLGAEAREVELAGWDPARTRKDAFLVIEAEAALLLGPEIAAEPDRFGTDFRAMLAFGAGLGGPRVVGAAATLHRVGVAARRLLREVDVLLLPTTPQRAFPHTTKPPANQGELTAIANAAGLPAVQIPVPIEGELPAGIQLVGPAWSEAWLVPLATRLGAALPSR